MLQQIYQLTPTLGQRLNEICSENQISGMCVKVYQKRSVVIFSIGFDITNLDQISPQDGAALIQQRLLIISDIVQMTIEPIPRKYTLNCIVSNRHLCVVFLENNSNTISSNIVAEDNNQWGNTGEFYK